MATKRDLTTAVALLNRKYKKTPNTAIRFVLLQAYGGYQVAIKYKYSGAVDSVTTGYKSATATYEQLNSYAVRKGLSAKVLRNHKSAMSRKPKNRKK